MNVKPTHYDLPCLRCGTKIAFSCDSATVQYGLNVFCPDKDCEDLYAAEQ